MIPNHIENEFSLDAGIVYLNHAAVAPWPRRTAEAVKQFADENASLGALHYKRWNSTEKELREQLRFLLNAPSEKDIALLKNTSEGLSVVAHGLYWKVGDNIVISNQEFPSNRIVWESLKNLGVEIREADLQEGTSPEDSLLDLVDARTRLLSVSSVQYASGLKLDLLRLGEGCHDRGVLFCIDAIQSLGVLPLDVQAIQADFVVADGHKWLLGPEGLAVFYCRSTLRDQLRLYQYGWHMVEQAGDFDCREWQPARSARRFECGSPNMLGIHALHASLSLLLEVGIPAVSHLIHENATYLLDALSCQSHIEILTPITADRYAGIVTFHHRKAKAEALWQYLSEHGVICAHRGGGIRLSPHFYNQKIGLEYTIKLIDDYMNYILL